MPMNFIMIFVFFFTINAFAVDMNTDESSISQIPTTALPFIGFSEDPNITREKIDVLNLEEKDIWRKKAWDHSEYNKVNFPIIVSNLENKESFSQVNAERGRGFLDLPIHMPDQGWRLPPLVDQFKEMIGKVIQCERLSNPNFENDHYVYITIAQSLVNPEESQRRSGWHADSYRRTNNKLGIDVDHVYLAYDVIPTLFSKGTFNFEGVDVQSLIAVLAHFNSSAEQQEIGDYPPYTLLRLDPYVVHNASRNMAEKPMFRTFVRISISKKRYRNSANTHNPLFNYNWEKTTRWDRQQHLKDVP
jgi:hypothetical protein